MSSNVKPKIDSQTVEMARDATALNVIIGLGTLALLTLTIIVMGKNEENSEPSEDY